MRALDRGLTGCDTCLLLVSSSAGRCPRCHTQVHARKRDSVPRTLALTLTAVILYVPANLLPIMTTTQLGRSVDSTILGGVVLLWNMGSYPVAAVIFIASVLVPVGKILALGMLCLATHRADVGNPRDSALLYRVTEFIGRWSMVDVFVVAILVALIQLGEIMSILPGPATLAFAGVVVTTMLAAESFDPRLIWDRSHHHG